MQSGREREADAEYRTMTCREGRDSRTGKPKSPDGVTVSRAIARMVRATHTVALVPCLLKAGIIRQFFKVSLLAMQFVNRAHHLCQGFIHGIRGIDDTTVIFKLFVARLPAFPFFPRCNLKVGNLPLAALQAAFLYVRWALTVNNQHLHIICSG